MSVIFRIRPAGLIDGATVPVITGATQDPATGIYDIQFTSPNSNFGVLDVQELFRVALGNTTDDFLIPQLILTDGGATTFLEAFKLTYTPGGGAEAGINRDLLWDYKADAQAVIGPKPFLNYTGQRLIVASNNGVQGEGEIYVVAYPVAGGEFLDAICCTTEAEAAAATTPIPSRAILPIMDVITDSNGPGLSYKVGAGDDLASIRIQGQNLTGIVSVTVSRDVQGPLGTANTGPAPIVGALTVTDTEIIVPLDCTLCPAFDLWGVILTDNDGNVYGAPSPCKIFLTS